MIHYRIYKVGSDGHFLDAQDIECIGDEEAIVTAKKAVDRHDIELWQQGRFVTRFRHTDPK